MASSLVPMDMPHLSCRLNQRRRLHLDIILFFRLDTTSVSQLGPLNKLLAILSYKPPIKNTNEQKCNMLKSYMLALGAAAIATHTLRLFSLIMTIHKHIHALYAAGMHRR